MLQLDKSNIYKILRDFHTLTHIRIVLYDENLNELMSYPREKSEFCACIDRNADMSRRCDASDRENCRQCARKQAAVHYRCHMGLSETTMPIRDHNGILGYVMFGQVLHAEGCEKTRKWLHSQLSDDDFPGISGMIDRIPVRTESELDACATVLQALVTYLLSNRWVTPERSEFIRHMDRFIDENISREITVEDICAEFHMRRTRLYSAATEYLGCSVAKYIRQRRIATACELLKTTDEKITEIAYEVGFSDYGHFSRVFAQQMGQSATAYRYRRQREPGKKPDE